MCLGAPGQVVRIEGSRAVVDFWGVQREVGLDLVDEPVQTGDYVLVHVGFAIRRIPHEEIDETLAFFAAMSRDEDASAPHENLSNPAARSEPAT